MQQQETTVLAPLPTPLSPSIYKPKGSRSLAELKPDEMQQIRLGMQGFGGTGKTWAATTFPNMVCISMDRGLGAHTGRADILEVRLYDPAISAQFGPTRKEALENWIAQEASKLTAEQTLVIDGSTGIQNAFIEWYSKNKVYTKQGKEDDFAPWRIKVEFFSRLCESFKTLKCHVIYICHEVPAKDKDGGYSGKIRPLLTGQFGDEIMTHFTDWVRCHAADKPKDMGAISPENLAKWGMKTVGEFKAMCDTFPRNTIYYWQVESDDFFDGKCSSLVNFPRFMPANFATFKSYMRKA